MNDFGSRLITVSTTVRHVQRPALQHRAYGSFNSASTSWHKAYTDLLG